jgi:hypothetical protein
VAKRGPTARMMLDLATGPNTPAQMRQLSSQHARFTIISQHGACCTGYEMCQLLSLVRSAKMAGSIVSHF